jgi:hypothetical protein
MMSKAVSVIILAASAGKYVLAAIAAVLAGLAVLLYATSSDLVKLKLFKFDAYSSLFNGSWSYAKAKKRARLAMKREGKRMRTDFVPSVRQYQGDIAIGALVITISLTLFLIIMLFSQPSQATIFATSTVKYIVAAIVAVLVGLAVLLFAASSDMVKLKLFKFDAYSSLFRGSWSYAKAKKRARLAMKREGKRLSDVSREKMPETARRINRDIAIGALVIAVVLLVLLIIGVV